MRAIFPDIASKQLCWSNTIYQSKSLTPSEKCFSTFLDPFSSPLSLSDHNHVCKACRILLLSISISHSTFLLPILSLSLSFLSSVLVQTLNINKGRLRSSWSAVPSLLLPSALMCVTQLESYFWKTFVASSVFFLLSFIFLYKCPNFSLCTEHSCLCQPMYACHKVRFWKLWCFNSKNSNWLFVAQPC